jgi:hypothetical protein
LARRAFQSAFHGVLVRLNQLFQSQTSEAAMQRNFMIRLVLRGWKNSNETIFKAATYAGNN